MATKHGLTKRGLTKLGLTEHDFTKRGLTKHGFAAYPPKVEDVDILGYVEEESGLFHSRDIGRSFELAGKIYLVFGDTFCKNSGGEFAGLASNTIALNGCSGE